MAKPTQTQAAQTQAAPATPATPAQMLQTLASAAKQQQSGVFLQTVQHALQTQVAPPLVLGGVQAPQRAGACCTVWLQYLHLLGAGVTPTVQAVLNALPNANTNNTKIEFYRCAKWFSALPAWVATQQQG